MLVEPNTASSQNVDMALHLCQCVEDWQALALDNEQNIKKFNWKEISQKMELKGINFSEADCCKMWKYLAYGKTMSADAATGSLSDDEDAFYQPLTALKRYKHTDGPHPWGSNNVRNDANVLKHYRPGPDIAVMRDQFKKIKVKMTSVASFKSFL